MAAIIITPAQLATELSTDARTTRKFLRSITPITEQPGKGARWAIKGNKQNLAQLRKKFAAFQTAQEEAKAQKAADAPAAPEAPTAPESDIATEPTDEELMAIDEERFTTDDELEDILSDAGLI